VLVVVEIVLKEVVEEDKPKLVDEPNEIDSVLEVLEYIRDVRSEDCTEVEAREK
jgi:hypothetical protein